MIGSRYASSNLTKPAGAPDCWGRAYDPNDADCAMNCPFDTSCSMRYARTHGGGSSSGPVGVSSKGSTVNHNNPTYEDEVREETPLWKQAGHNMVLGAGQAMLDELYSLLARFLGGIHKF